jgi:TetR/AcrR family transcriptional regulator
MGFGMADTARAPATRSERRKARTTTAIMDAAERHFLERGFQDAKVDEIAEEADVAVGSVYNHFGSKEGLYRGVLERALDLFAGYMDDGAEPDGPALERLLELAGRVARFGRERPGHLRMLVLPHPRQAEELLREPLDGVRKAMAAQERRTAALIEAAVRRGDARPLDSRRAAAFLWSAWLGALALGQRPDRELRALLEAGLRVVMGGIASETTRESSEVVRALLESSGGPARPHADGEPEPEALIRAPVLGTLRADLPELALWTAETAARLGPSPEPVLRRLTELGGPSAAEAEGARRESTPWAYRVLARQIGADSPPRSTSAESASSAGLPDDALTIATAQTGVPLLAFDAAKLDGGLALRRARAGERLGDDELDEGRVVMADRGRPLALLLGSRAPHAEVGNRTRRILLAAVQAKGVPTLAVEEALWTAIEILREGG